MQKIVVAVTGASGSIYAKILLTKLLDILSPSDQLSVVITENAKQVWHTELEDDSYKNVEVQ